MSNISLDMLKMNKFIDQKLASISEARIGKRLRGWAIAAYQDALTRVPQWSGHMVSNLRLSVNGVEAPYDNSFYVENWRSLKPPFDSEKNPNAAAIASANTANGGLINSHYPSMYDTYELKYAEGSHSGYFGAVEVGAMDLREVNRPSHALELGVAYAKRKYTKNLSTKVELEGLEI